MIKVYGDILSGNCYKVKLLLSLLEIDHEWIHVDILNKETQAESFLHKNPVGKIPLVELSKNVFLSESNAILNYFANGTSYLPDNNLLRAKVLQWQFFEQYSHEPYIAVARFIAKYLNMLESRLEEFKSLQIGGNKALSIMNEQLAKTLFLVGDVYTISDISLYGYTHVANEGGFDLLNYPYILAWLERIKSHPKHVTIEQYLK